MGQLASRTPSGVGVCIAQDDAVPSDSEDGGGPNWGSIPRGRPRTTARPIRLRSVHSQHPPGPADSNNRSALSVSDVGMSFCGPSDDASADAGAGAVSAGEQPTRPSGVVGWMCCPCGVDDGKGVARMTSLTDSSHRSACDDDYDDVDGGDEGVGSEAGHPTRRRVGAAGGALPRRPPLASGLQVSAGRKVLRERGTRAAAAAAGALAAD